MPADNSSWDIKTSLEAAGRSSLASAAHLISGVGYGVLVRSQRYCVEPSSLSWGGRVDGNTRCVQPEHRNCRRRRSGSSYDYEWRRRVRMQNAQDAPISEDGTCRNGGSAKHWLVLFTVAALVALTAATDATLLSTSSSAISPSRQMKTTLTAGQGSPTRPRPERPPPRPTGRWTSSGLAREPGRAQSRHVLRGGRNFVRITPSEAPPPATG